MSDRLLKLLEQQQQLQARIKKEQQKQAGEERRKRTRSLIILGAALARAKVAEPDIFRHVINTYIINERDLLELRDGDAN